MVKYLPAMWETQVQSLDLEDPLEKGTATHSSVLGCRIPWTEKPGGLQSLGSHRVRHNWESNTFTFFNIKSNKRKRNSSTTSFQQSNPNCIQMDSFIFLKPLQSRIKTSFSLLWWWGGAGLRVNRELFQVKLCLFSYLPEYWGDSLFEAHLVHIILQSSSLRSWLKILGENSAEWG